jgi:hypothetical protein
MMGRSVVCFFILLRNTLLYEHTIICPDIFLVMCIWVISYDRVLWLKGHDTLFCILFNLLAFKQYISVFF